jgi:MuDR family transposase
VTNVTQEPHTDEDPLLENDVNPLSKNDMHKETTINDIVQAEPTIAYDLENSKIEVGALFPDVHAFRMALRHFAIKNEFEIGTEKLDKKRFIGKYRHSSCHWRIHASILQDRKTFMVCMYNLFIFINQKYNVMHNANKTFFL